ncbi:MAG: hypothetical protein EHM91_13510 [Planctomycetota bacterium]|nr:MAG: hypothetical protein EHM91_13510 [Planctomycetota bacterium]
MKRLLKLVVGTDEVADLLWKNMEEELEGAEIKSMEFTMNHLENGQRQWVIVARSAKDYSVFELDYTSH